MTGSQRPSMSVVLVKQVLQRKFDTMSCDVPLQTAVEVVSKETALGAEDVFIYCRFAIQGLNFIIFAISQSGSKLNYVLFDDACKPAQCVRALKEDFPYLREIDDGRLQRNFFDCNPDAAGHVIMQEMTELELRHRLRRTSLPVADEDVTDFCACKH